MAVPLSPFHHCLLSLLLKEGSYQLQLGRPTCAPGWVWTLYPSISHPWLQAKCWKHSATKHRQNINKNTRIITGVTRRDTKADSAAKHFSDDDDGCNMQLSEANSLKIVHMTQLFLPTQTIGHCSDMSRCTMHKWHSRKHARESHRSNSITYVHNKFQLLS